MTSDKTYAVENRVNNLIDSLAPLQGPNGDQTISTGWATGIGNLAVSVVAGQSYYFKARIIASQGTTGGQSQLVGITGPATGSCWLIYTDVQLGGPPVIQHQMWETSLTDFGTATYTTGTIWQSEFEGNVTFSSGGTMTLAGGSAGGITWKARSYACYLIVTPANPVG